MHAGRENQPAEIGRYSVAFCRGTILSRIELDKSWEGGRYWLGIVLGLASDSFLWLVKYHILLVRNLHCRGHRGLFFHCDKLLKNRIYLLLSLLLFFMVWLNQLMGKCWTKGVRNLFSSIRYTSSTVIGAATRKNIFKIGNALCQHVKLPML